MKGSGVVVSFAFPIITKAILTTFYGNLDIVFLTVPTGSRHLTLALPGAPKQRQGKQERSVLQNNK